MTGLQEVKTGAESGGQDSPPPWVGALLDGIKEHMTAPPEARCLSREQTAAALGISVRSLDTLSTTDNGPPCFMLGGRRLYPLASLKKWIAERIKDR
jgi:hypothetical protein